MGARQVAPPKRVVGATFVLRIPLPSRFNGKYDPANRPSSTPILLKPGERPRFTKPRKSSPAPEPKAKQPTTTPAKRIHTPKVKRTAEERSEYEQARSQKPERKEYNRQYQRKRNQIAKEIGKCKICPNPAIPGQTRCETCAETHRQARRTSDAARSKEKRNTPSRLAA